MGHMDEKMSRWLQGSHKKYGILGKLLTILDIIISGRELSLLMFFLYMGVD